MKRRILFLSIALVVLFIAGLLLFQKRQFAQESHQGRHTREWAWALISGTNETDLAEAVTALRTLGSKAVPPLRRMVADRNKLYEEPVLALARMLPSKQRQMIVQQLRPGQASANRQAALAAIQAIGPVAAEAIPELRRALEEPSGEVRWDAARALRAIGDAAIPTLVSATASTNPAVRHAAIYALAQPPTNSLLVTATLFNAMFDADENVRTAAVYFVGQLGLDAVPVLLEKLVANDQPQRIAAMRAMLALRPPTRLVTTNLLMLATNSAGEQRRQAIETMGALRINSTNVASVIMAALDDAEPAIRVAAMRAVADIYWKTTSAIPQLIEFTRSASVIEREAAALALGRFGESASNAVPAISSLLDDGNPQVRAAATNALLRIAAPVN